MKSSGPKDKVRRGVLHNRQLLAEHVYAQRCQQVMHHSMQLLAERHITCVHTFLPIVKNREVNTWPLLEQFQGQVILSVTDFRSRTMHHVQYQPGMEMVTDRLGIPTPVGGEAADLATVQAVLIPLLAADKAGQRIGYGQGYYDRLLPLMPAALKVGLSLAPLFDAFLFAEPHDQPLNCCVTPRGVWWI